MPQGSPATPCGHQPQAEPGELQLLCWGQSGPWGHQGWGEVSSGMLPGLSPPTGSEAYLAF